MNQESESIYQQEDREVIIDQEEELKHLLSKGLGALDQVILCYHWKDLENCAAKYQPVAKNIKPVN